MTQGCTAHVAHRPHAPQGNYELAIVCLFLITQFLNVNFVDNVVLKCQRVGQEPFPEPSPGTGSQWLVEMLSWIPEASVPVFLLPVSPSQALQSCACWYMKATQILGIRLTESSWDL